MKMKMEDLQEIIREEVRKFQEQELNEAPPNRKYMPSDINYRRVFGGSDGVIVKQTKRLSQIAADLDDVNEPVSKELMDGFYEVMDTVHKKLKRVKVQ